MTAYCVSFSIGDKSGISDYVAVEDINDIPKAVTAAWIRGHYDAAGLGMPHGYTIRLMDEIPCDCAYLNANGEVMAAWADQIHDVFYHLKLIFGLEN